MATITFQGNPLHTSGELPAVGSKAPDFTLVNGKVSGCNPGNLRRKKESTEYSTESGYAYLRHFNARIQRESSHICITPLYWLFLLICRLHNADFVK